jgi:glyoxylate carboligase
MVAAVAHTLNGDTARAASWAANVRERSPTLDRRDFFRAFPIKPEPMRVRVSHALAILGF